MVLSSKWRTLSHDLIELGGYVLQRSIGFASNSMIALYESTFDQSYVTSGSTQVYEGHDHGANGGGPFARGCVYSEDGGTSPLFEATIAKGATNVFQYAIGGGAYYVSPGMNGSALEGWILYNALDSDFEIIITENNKGRVNLARSKKRSYAGISEYRTTLKQTSSTSPESTNLQWAPILCPFFPDEKNNGPFLRFRPANDQTESTLEIYSIQLVESRSVSMVQQYDQIWQGGKP